MLFLLLWKHAFLLCFFFVTCLFHPLEYFAAWFFAKKEKIVDLSANENSSNSFPAQGFPPFSSRAGVSYWRRLKGIVVACCSGAFLGRSRKHWNALWLHGTKAKKAPWPFPGPLLRILHFALSSLLLPYWPHFLLFPSFFFFQNRTWRPHRENTGWALTFPKTDTCAFRVSVVKPQTRRHASTKPLFFSLSQYLEDNNLLFLW